MKIIAIVFSMFMLVSLSTNAQSKKVSKMMDNQKNRTEIYSSIANNHEFMQEFMQAVNGSEHATMMMQNNVHQNDGMMNGSKDSETLGDNNMGMMNGNMKCNMMSASSENHNSQCNMMKTMSQSNETMKTCQKMMGSDITENNTNGEKEETGNSQEHLQHHK